MCDRLALVFSQETETKTFDWKFEHDEQLPISMTLVLYSDAQSSVILHYHLPAIKQILFDV